MNNKDLMRKNTLFIIYFAVFSRILILIRGMVVASKLGVSYKVDSYLLALSTIMLVTKIVGDGIIVALIPIFQEIKEKYGADKKVEYTNNLVNLTILISVILFITGYFGAPTIMKIFGPGFGELELQKAILLFRIGLPIITLYWIKSIGGGYLQSEHAFKAGAKGGVAYELVLILYLMFFASKYELRGYMVATILATASQVYLIYKTMWKKGYRYELRLDFKDRYIGKVLVFLLPIVLSVGVNELNSSIDNAIASTLPAGSITELNYANQITNFFISLFIVAIVTVIFPVLSESHNKKDIENLKGSIKQGIRTLLIITIPITIILMVMAEPIVKIFFERGAFGWEASFFTSQALVYYALGLPAMALTPLIVRAYYSIQDMQTPVVISLITLVTNTILSLLFAPMLGAKGIALGTSLSTIIAVLVGLINLNKKLSIYKTEDIDELTVKLLFAATAMIIGISLVYAFMPTLTSNLFLYNIIIVSLSSIVGIGLYGLIYRYVNINDIKK